MAPAVDRLLVNIDADGRASVSVWLAGEQFPKPAGDPIEVAWPLDGQALEDLRWYLEDYLRFPFAVYSDRGAVIAGRIPEWGESLFEAVFGSAPARAAYAAVRARGNPVEVVFQSTSAQQLGLPWELMRDPSRGVPLALDQVAVTRSLPTDDLMVSFPADQERLRVLMVISRPAGDQDVGYQMIARPLVERLEAVRGNVDLVVLRPPTLDHLQEVLARAAEAGEPFQVVHFDGHGMFGDGRTPSAGWNPLTYRGPSPQGMLMFEKPGGGSDPIPAERVAQVLSAGRVPVVVLNACQSGQVGGELEAAVATRLVQGGAASVVAMAYSVYAVAAAEFMAAFYERLFAGDRVADAVTAGRARLALRDERPSPKGKLPLADWVVPVHYLRRDVRFPNLRTERTGASLNEVLDQLRAAPDAGTSDQELAPVGTFVGRDGLFYTLESAARLQRVVILYGPGGTGKSELAKAFGRWWRTTGGVDHPDGVIWHSFEPGVASFGLAGVITGIGLKLFGPQFALADPGERRQIVQRLLAEHRLLLIWDNFESVRTLPDPTAATPALSEEELDEIRQFLAHIARSGRSSVLLTSRTPEDWLGELRRIPVGGLSADEAIEYADQLLEPFPQARPRRRRRAFADLMEWLDGHPLSMRLTLPHLDTTDPERLLTGLRGTTPLPGRDDGERTTSLPASIAYSFIHLPHTDQQALTAITLLHGIADATVLGMFSQVPEAPQRFRDLGIEDWVRILDGAAAVGLLTGLGGGMYRIHPALPAYLAEQWRTHHPDTFTEQHSAATRALLDAYADLGRWLDQQVSGDDAQFVIAVIHLQRRNLGSMLGYALDHRLWGHAQDITQPLISYWEYRGLTQEAQGWTDRARLALETPEGTPPRLDTPAGRLWLLVLGSEANRQLVAHHLDQAHHTYLDILHTLQQHPSIPQQLDYLAITNHHLGVIAQERGRWDEAEEWHRTSLTIFKELDRRSGTASCYHQLGVVAEERGRWDEAEEWHRTSLTILEELGNRSHMADSYHRLGVVAQRRGRQDEAEEWYRASLAIKEELGDRSGMAGCYHQLGRVAEERGQWDEAEEWFRTSLTILEKLGNRSHMARSYHQLGVIAQKRGRQDEAEEWYRKSLAIKEELDNRPGMARSYHQLGMVAQERGRWDEAEEWYRKSLTIFEELGDRPHMADSYHQFGMVAHLRGQWDEAEEWYRKCLAIFEELGDRSGMATGYGQLGLLAEARERPVEALDRMVKCVSLLGEFPHPATDPVPRHLKRLTAELGMPALEHAWHATTGRPLPSTVRTYVQQPET